MSFIERLRRLWELSSPGMELISREEYDALMVHLKEVEAEMQDMNYRISDWIGTLMNSELLRREALMNASILTEDQPPMDVSVDNPPLPQTGAVE